MQFYLKLEATFSTDLFQDLDNRGIKYESQYYMDAAKGELMGWLLFLLCDEPVTWGWWKNFESAAVGILDTIDAKIVKQTVVIDGEREEIQKLIVGKKIFESDKVAIDDIHFKKPKVENSN